MKGFLILIFFLHLSSWEAVCGLGDFVTDDTNDFVTDDTPHLTTELVDSRSFQNFTLSFRLSLNGNQEYLGFLERGPEFREKLKNELLTRIKDVSQKIPGSTFFDISFSRFSSGSIHAYFTLLMQSEKGIQNNFKSALEERKSLNISVAAQKETIVTIIASSLVFTETEDVSSSSFSQPGVMPSTNTTAVIVLGVLFAVFLIAAVVIFLAYLREVRKSSPLFTSNESRSPTEVGYYQPKTSNDFLAMNMVKEQLEDETSQSSRERMIPAHQRPQQRPGAHVTTTTHTSRRRRSYSLTFERNFLDHPEDEADHDEYTHL